jgi:hypothetical protein
MSEWKLQYGFLIIQTYRQKQLTLTMEPKFNSFWLHKKHTDFKASDMKQTALVLSIKFFSDFWFLIKKVKEQYRTLTVVR